MFSTQGALVVLLPEDRHLLWSDDRGFLDLLSDGINLPSVFQTTPHEIGLTAEAYPSTARKHVQSRLSKALTCQEAG